MILTKSKSFLMPLALILTTGCGTREQKVSKLLDDSNSQLQCAYDGDNFKVQYFGSSYSEFADDNFANAQVGCGTNVAILYDGDNMIAFDGNRRTFRSEFADDDFQHAVVAAGTDVAGGYDGDNFIVFDAEESSFRTEFARDNIWTAAIAAGEGVVMLYDGNDMMVYDAKNNTFSSQFADDSQASARVAGGRGGALGYDGDNLFGYCGYLSQWTSKFADDNQVATPRRNRTTLVPQIQLGSKVWELDPLTCDIKSL